MKQFRPENYRGLSIAIATITILSFIGPNAWARAGGGGGSAEGVGLMGILGVILAPVLLVYGILVTIRLNRKNKEAEQLLLQIQREDDIWNLRKMKGRVERAFLKVQKAWEERNQDLAKSFMSERLYEKHKLQTDDMIAKGQINHLSNINIIDIKIIGVEDHDNPELDAFSAHIKAQMVDYLTDHQGRVIKGDQFKSEEFSEIWHFVRQGTQWMVDEIDQRVSLRDLQSARVFKEN